MRAYKQAHQPKLGRKRWLKDTIKFIELSSVFIDLDYTEDGNELIAVLAPWDGKFRIKSIELDKKKCILKEFDSRIIFSEHYIVRLMQSVKSIKLKDLQYYFNKSYNEIILDNLLKKELNEYEFYVKGMGCLILKLIEEGSDGKEIVIKTIIEKDSLSGRKNLVYQKMVDLGFKTNIKRIKSFT